MAGGNGCGKRGGNTRTEKYQEARLVAMRCTENVEMGQEVLRDRGTGRVGRALAESTDLLKTEGLRSEGVATGSQGARGSWS